MNSSKRNGSALILVLLVVAIITTIGVSTTNTLHSDIDRVYDYSQRHQAYWYALGLESKVSDFLKERQQIRKLRKVLIPDQDIPRIMVNIEGGNIEGTLKDLRTCFNLNSIIRYDSENKTVINQGGVDQYRNLLVILNVDSFTQDQLVYSLLDWVDSNDFSEDISGAEDDYYTRLTSPHRTPNQPLVSLEELNSIKNYDPNTIQMLKPFVCSLPEIGSTGINVNAIPSNTPEILVMLLGEEISLSSASNILNDRPLTGFIDKADFLSHPEFQNLQFSNVIQDQILTSSDYYLLTTKVSNFSYPFMMKSILHIIDSGEVKVLIRSQEVF